MTRPEQHERLRSIRGYAEEILDELSRCSLMYAPDMASCEQMACRMLDIRALCLGVREFDWKSWCQSNYAEIPGPIRHMAGAIETRFVAERDRVKAFTNELARMIAFERAAQDEAAR